MVVEVQTAADKAAVDKAAADKIAADKVPAGIVVVEVKQFAETVVAVVVPLLCQHAVPVVASE